MTSLLLHTSHTAPTPAPAPAPIPTQPLTPKVTSLLLHLAHDAENAGAIAKAGAVARLVAQLRGGGRTSVKAQELAAAVLSYLSALDECVKAITAANGIRPLVAMLTAGTPVAQSHAAASLSALASGNPRNCKQIISEGAIPPLVSRDPSHPPTLTPTPTPKVAQPSPS